MILSNPVTDIRKLFQIKNTNNQIQDNALFFDTGGEALVFGLNEIKFDKEKTILLPSYICKSVSEILKSNGFTICFIDINKSLSIDIKKFADLLSSNSRIGAFLLIHYFGFRNEDIKEIHHECNKREVLLIEDCCHCSFNENHSEDNLYSDFKIYSLRKFINIQ